MYFIRWEENLRAWTIRAIERERQQKKQLERLIARIWLNWPRRRSCYRGGWWYCYEYSGMGHGLWQPVQWGRCFWQQSWVIKSLL